MSDAEKRIIDDLTALGEKVAYCGFHTITETPFELYIERCKMRPDMVEGIENPEAFLMTVGRKAYEDGFKVGKLKPTLAQKLDKIRKEKFEN